MTQILAEEFSIDLADAPHEVRFSGHAQIAGAIVAARILFALEDVEAGRRSPIVVTALMGGYNAALLPNGGLDATIFERLPLRIEVGAGYAITMRLRCAEPRKGRAIVVVHAEPDIPRRFAMELVAR